MAEAAKSCYICGSSDHLRRDCPNKESQQDQRKCYNCGQTGHISGKCPNAASGDNGGRPPRREPREPREPRQPRGAASEGKKCYNCGGDHLARDCPQPQAEGNNRPARSSPRGNGEGAPRRPSKGIKCYNCGGLGHISKECPQAGQGPMCYKCQQFGHISSQCPNAAAEGVNEAL